MDDLHAGRLHRLADFLDELEPERFDLAHWRRGPFDCRMVGCAGGWATTIPEFKAAGLHFVDDAPRFEYYLGLDACCQFFGLSYAKARHVFLPDCYDNGAKTTPTVVARRLRAAAADVTCQALREIE